MPNNPKDPINTNITFYNEIIENQPITKYLGIHLDKKLYFTHHVDITLKKANKILNLLYPILNRFNPLQPKIKIQIYKTYLQPILLYAAPCWSNISNTNIAKFKDFKIK